MMLPVLSLVPVLKHQFNELINGTSQINKHQKSNIWFFRWHDYYQKFLLKLTKNKQGVV